MPYYIDSVVAQWYEKRKKGLSADQIADEAGVSRGTVFKYLKTYTQEHNLPVLTSKNTCSDAEMKQWYEKRKQGMSITQIALEAGIPKATCFKQLMKYIQKHNLPVITTQNTYTEAEIKQWYEQRQAGTSAKAVGELIGVSRRVIITRTKNYAENKGLPVLTERLTSKFTAKDYKHWYTQYVDGVPVQVIAETNGVSASLIYTGMDKHTKTKRTAEKNRTEKSCNLVDFANWYFKRQQGISISDIAAEAGVSSAYVYKGIAKYTVVNNLPNMSDIRIHSDENEIWYTKRKEGISFEAIAADAQRSVAVIKSGIKKHEEDTGVSSVFVTPYDKDSLAQVYLNRLKGATIVDIAKELNLSPERVYGILTEYANQHSLPPPTIVMRHYKNIKEKKQIYALVHTCSIKEINSRLKTNYKTHTLYLHITAFVESVTWWREHMHTYTDLLDELLD